MKILICQHHRFELWNAPPWIADRLRSEFAEAEVIYLASYENLETEIQTAEVFIGLSLRREQFLAARNLRWIHSPSAAVHQLLIPEIVASDIVVTNSARVHGPVVAEHAIALLMALAKRLPLAVRRQLEGEWAQQAIWDADPKPREVSGGTLCVIGLGSIGNHVARLAKALGMRVVAVREHLAKGKGFADEIFSSSELDKALPQADYVVIAAPLTGATRELISETRLSLMKRDAYLINVARGALVDEAALAAALKNKLIAGAALDVFASEPLPPGSPLWNLENLLITPHTAAVAEKLWERHYDLIRENLHRYLRGEPLVGIVDKQQGY